MTTTTKQEPKQLGVESRRVEPAKLQPVSADELLRFMMDRYGNVLVRLADQ